MDPRTRAHRLQRLREHTAAIDLAGLVAEHGTPLTVIDPVEARARLADLQAELPFVHLDVVADALAHPALLHAVWGHAGFSVCGLESIAMLEQAGVPADGAVLLRPSPSPHTLARAYAAGVRTVPVTTPAHVDAVARLPKDLLVLVRVATDADGAGTTPDRVPHLIRYALSKGVNVRGLAIHLGAAMRTAALESAVAACLRLFDAVERELGIRLDMLDLGGGFPTAAAHHDVELGEIAASLRRLLGPHRGRLRVSAAPGRLVAAPAAVQAVRVTDVQTRGSEVWYSVDDGLGGGFARVALDGAEPQLFGLDEALGATERLLPATVAGASGAARDVIATRQLLPALAVGDVLLAPLAGGTALTAAARTGAVMVADPHREAGFAPELLVV